MTFYVGAFINFIFIIFNEKIILWEPFMSLFTSTEIALFLTLYMTVSNWSVIKSIKKCLVLLSG